MNILITNNGINGNFVKLSDFGSANIYGLGTNDEINNDLKGSNTIILSKNKGTPGFIAPEVKKTNIYDITADIYSISVTMKQLLLISDYCEYPLKYESEFTNNDNNIAKLTNFKEEIFHLYRKCGDRMCSKNRLLCDKILSCFEFKSSAKNMSIIFDDIKYEKKIKQLCYEFGELNYRPHIEKFTDYFLINTIQRKICAKNYAINHEISITNAIKRINEYKIKYNININCAQEVIEIIYNEFYVNLSISYHSLYEKELLHKLSNETKTNWYTIFTEMSDVINLSTKYNNLNFIFIDMDFIKFENPMLRQKNVLLCSIIKSNETTTPEAIICHCDESYTKFKEKVLLIVNEVIVNNLEINIEFMENEINRQLENVFEEKVFCYLTKYMSIIENCTSIKIALRFCDFNILVSDKEIKKYKLHENSLQNMIFKYRTDIDDSDSESEFETDIVSEIEVESDEPIISYGPRKLNLKHKNLRIIQKALDLNFILGINNVKLIEIENIKCVVLQESSVNKDTDNHKYRIKVENKMFYLTLFVKKKDLIEL